MNLPNPQNSTRDSEFAVVALSLNQELAQRVKRWKQVRLTMAILLTVIGVALFFVDSVAVFSVPFLLAACLAALLYLDARDEWREVNARKWQFPTPKTGRLIARKEPPIQKSATS